jgi:hypothetical protein
LTSVEISQANKGAKNKMQFTFFREDNVENYPSMSACG